MALRGGEIPAEAGRVARLRPWSPPPLPSEPYPLLLPYTHPDLLAGRERDLEVAGEQPDLDLLAPGEALDALVKDEPRLAEVVQLRYFAGLGVAETAELLGTSPATVERDWTFARAWLLERMS